MEPGMLGLLSVILLLVFLVMGVPVAISMGFCGLLLLFIAAGLEPAVGMTGLVTWSQWHSFDFTVIPLFVLMGVFVYESGMGTEIFLGARAWVGNVPGGLAIATVLGCGMFGAISGSSVACTATMGKICIPEMLKAGYDKRLAAGVVASAGPLAAMIPPSILMVIYGIITEQSIAKLLIAGVLPGILQMVIYAIFILVWVKVNPNVAPVSLKTSWTEKAVAVKYVWRFAILATVIIGGIYSGIFTATEAAAVSAFITLVFGMAYRKLHLKGIMNALLETVKINGMILLIIAACFIFMALFAISQVPQQVSAYMSSLEVNKYIVLSGVYVMYYFLGCLLSPIPMMFLTLPLIFPAIVALGFDPIWFGVIMVLLCEIGNITPPFALSIFTLASVAPELGMGTIIKGIWRFVIANTIALIILTIFPIIATLLPSMMGK